MDELDSFLKEGTQPRADGGPGQATQPAPAPAEKAAAETPPAEPKAPAKPTEPAAKAKEPDAKEPKADDAPEDEEVAPHTGSDNRTVPFSALEKVRADWKSKAAAAEARAEELRRQLEEAKRPPPAPAPTPQPVVQQIPDFNTDPQGYVHALVVNQRQQMLNERLNMSEAMLRDKIGSDKVDQYVNDFKAFAEKDPTLFPKLYGQATPYQWMVGEIDRRRMQAEIGDDPSAYEAKLRAKWEQERVEAGGNGNGQAAPRGPGLPAQPPSLASMRSVAGRSQATFTGPPSMDDILRRPDRRAQH